MSNQVTESTTPTRFEIRGDGGTAVLDYVEQGNVWHLTHTYVPNELRGQGVAAVLVKHALEAARSRGKKIVPDCSYVEAYVARNSQYKDLLA